MNKPKPILDWRGLGTTNPAQLHEVPKASSLPQVRTASQRLEDAKSQPDILPLVGEIWKSQELHILFADTGVGKSILAVTIAELLSKGHQLGSLENGVPKQKVLFYDFELSDKQFQKRYSSDDGSLMHTFSSNFLIDTIDWYELDKAYSHLSLEDQIFTKIEGDLKQTGAQVLVVDNLTFLQTQTTEKTDVALGLMRRLIEFKREYELSILVLAHTPKKPNNVPISLNHLAGSKQLPNFADSVSAIGKSSQGPQIRYWKQIKPSRSGMQVYDSQNVLVYEVKKRFQTFLSFEFIGYDLETNHLGFADEQQQDSNREKAVELKSSGKSVREIAEILGLSKSTIGRWVKD